MEKRRVVYPPDFKGDAVRLVQEGVKSVAAVARELGISVDTLHRWVKQAQLDAGERQDGLTTEEREELRRLRRQVRVLQEEREILKKAATFFAKETEPHR
jgi:transposase